jgi:DNA-binding NarL/FixJ family response regulator
MSEVHDLVLPLASRGGAATRRPKGARPISHPTVWDSDRRLSAVEPETEATRVYLYAKDTILRAGVATQLRRSPQIMLAEEYGPDGSGVAIVVADELDEELTTAICAVRRSCTPRIVVITNRFTRTGVKAAVHAGAWLFLRRSDAHYERLAQAARRLAAADGPPASVDEVIGDLAVHVIDDEPVTPVRPAGLCDRDMEVLRLMAEGQTTAGIARDLAYSESTIKNIIHAIVRELGARNRAHAVAMALRSQLI